MKLLVKTLKEDRYEVECVPSDSVGNIKQKVAVQV